MTFPGKAGLARSPQR